MTTRHPLSDETACTVEDTSCPVCKGSGEIASYATRTPNDPYPADPCRACNGSGDETLTDAEWAERHYPGAVSVLAELEPLLCDSCGNPGAEVRRKLHTTCNACAARAAEGYDEGRRGDPYGPLDRAEP
jgi:hypothetical protein